MPTHDELLLRQFDPQAAAYAESPVHAAGPDLAEACRLVAATLPRTATALDVGTGAGHLALALARSVGHVVATDPSPGMLAAAQDVAGARGMRNLDMVPCGADRLPFPEGRFCLVATRYSAHHWRDVAGGLREMRRVVKPGGYLLVIDVLGHDEPLVDTHLQALEVLRDPGHARNLDARQWRDRIVAAGFSVLEERRWPVRLEFATWIGRQATPPDAIAALRLLQRRAPAEVRDALRYEPDGSFTVTTGLVWARAGS